MRGGRKGGGRKHGSRQPEQLAASIWLGGVVIPGNPIIYAKWPEKRNGGRNGKNGVSQPTNVKAVMVRQCRMCKGPPPTPNPKEPNPPERLGCVASGAATIGAIPTARATGPARTAARNRTDRHRIAKKKHSILLCPNSKGGAIIQPTAWRTVATNTVMMNRLMGESRQRLRDQLLRRLARAMRGGWKGGGRKHGS